jgi:pimeloyl-ACP methyl ester carboxylesterase
VDLLRIAAPLALASGLLLAGCGGGSSGVPRPGSDLTWFPCTAEGDCAFFTVPIDEDHPDRGSFELPVARVAAQGDRIGVLFVNPGGPGGSGVGLALATPAFFPKEVLERFDIIGFDPRGAGASAPGIHCVDSLADFVGLDLTPDDAAERQALLDVNRALAEGCQERSGDILRFVGTDRVARDMDRLREVLGEDEISYLGYSYGTFLGALYADAFPGHVRAMVLDGAVDPAKDGADLIVGQALGFEAELDAFLAGQAKDPMAKFHAGGDPGAAFDALMADIDAQPFLVKQKSGPARTLGPGEAWYAVTEALYSRGNWDFLAEALATAQKGDGTELLAAADQAVGRAPDGTYDHFYESYLAISAIDIPSPTAIADYDALADQVRPKAPRLGVALVYSSVSPIFWPVPPLRTPAPIAADGAPPIVVLGNLGDPATPYADAQALASELSSGVLLTWTGGGHTAFGGNSECIDDAVTTYLVEKKAPKDGTRCD